ncbi:MAG: hypothetical protein JWR72_2163 [Flavisolibacter sp.]|jgi:hypothetical protein|nr:hypothetical protein [Flavisolibacter sp.]
MKFLNVYCESRKASVFINLDKVVLITKLDNDSQSSIELAGLSGDPVNVAMRAEDLIRKINGEDKEAVGFRTGR